MYVKAVKEYVVITHLLLLHPWSRHFASLGRQCCNSTLPHNFLQALQGSGTAEEALLPEEEEDDEEFMLDLDELTAAGEEAFASPSPGSPLQTRFGG